MKLLMSPASPFARKCRVLLREADLLDSIEEITVTTTALNSDPTVVSANPLGKIPALIRTNAGAIYDSRVITRFLDDHAQAGLYPEAGLWDILTLEATADAIMESALAMTYEVRMRPENERSPAWIEAQWQKAHRAVGALEARWMGHLEGPLHMGQVAVACALSYIDLRHDDRGWRNRHPALTAWHASFCDRESMLATNPA